MHYTKFENILNQGPFEESKRDLIKSIGKELEVYVSIFSSLKPEMKALHELLNYQDTQFNQSLRVIVGEYLKDNGFKLLDNKEILESNLIYSDGNRIIFILQTTWDNNELICESYHFKLFQSLVTKMQQQYTGKHIVGFMYFVDEKLTDSKKYYKKAIKNLAKTSDAELYLCYGDELFITLGMERSWQELTKHLGKWHKTLADLPNLDFVGDLRQKAREMSECGESRDG